MIKKIFLNFNTKILKIAGSKFFLYYLFYFIANIQKIIKNRNLDILNNKFKKLHLTFYQKNFFFDIQQIDKISQEKNSFGLIREIFFRNIYLKYFKFPKDCELSCIDLGCNIGIFSVLASKIFKEVKSFDVNKKYFKPYKKIMSDNKSKNCKFFNYLVGSSKLKRKNNENKINLNHFIKLQKLKNIFLKIDIEGYEFGLFENLDLKNIVCLSIEVHQNCGNINKLIKKIKNNKFVFILVNDLSEIVNKAQKATYIYAVKSESGIVLKL